MENKSHAMAAGLFVLVVAGLLLALASWLMRDKRTGDVYEMSTSESVTGLSEQAAVRFRGINVGKVVSIGFDPLARENVLVRINIESNLPLNSSTYATLGYQGVTGLAFVQLDNEGAAGAPLSTDNAQPTRIPLRPGLLSQFADQGTFLLQQAKNISERISVLLSPENQKTIIGTVETIGASADKLGAASERMQAILDAQIGPQRTSIPALVTDTRAAMNALKDTAADLRVSAAAATQTLQSINTLTQGISAKDGALDQLESATRSLNETVQAANASVLPGITAASSKASATAEAATRTAHNADRLINTLKDNPQSLLFGAGKAVPGPGEPGFQAPKP